MKRTKDGAYRLRNHLTRLLVRLQDGPVRPRPPVMGRHRGEHEHECEEGLVDDSSHDGERARHHSAQKEATEDYPAEKRKEDRESTVKAKRMISEGVQAKVGKTN